MVQAGIEAIPYAHPSLDEWRENFKGVRHFHPTSGFEVSGAIDDLWKDINTGQLIVVDYKATAKDSEVGIDAGWQISYKRQMEFYQWLLRQNGLDVSDTGYFVYCNGDRSQDRFDGVVRFKISVIPYTGNTSWVEPAPMAADPASSFTRHLRRRRIANSALILMTLGSWHCNFSSAGPVLICSLFPHRRTQNSSCIPSPFTSKCLVFPSGLCCRWATTCLHIRFRCPASLPATTSSVKSSL